MDRFEYRQGELYCEAVPVRRIAEAVGTPVYIYSADTLRSHYRALAAAFAELSPLICFSVKSLANLHVLRLLAAEGAGFDVVSGGELFRVAKAGGDLHRVVFAGVGKTDAEISAALAAGIASFNVESEEEFENLSRLAAAAGVTAHAALRVNPDIDPKTHRYTATGKKETKFGVDIERAERFFARYGRDAHVRLDGVHLHIGSPIWSAGPYQEAIAKALELIDRLRRDGVVVDTLNLGGGFAADYGAAAAPPAAEYAATIVPMLRGRGLKVILEPGRSIDANSGVLLTCVLYLKEGGERKFTIVDAAMTDLIRPALYDSFHFLWPVRSPQPPRRSSDYAPEGCVKTDVVGGVCESTDFLAKDRLLPPLERGDLLCVFTAGAYGFVMSSQYNSRPRAAEVLVDGDQFRIIRRRESYEDLVAAEMI